MFSFTINFYTLENDSSDYKKVWRLFLVKIKFLNNTKIYDYIINDPSSVLLFQFKYLFLNVFSKLMSYKKMCF